MKKYFTPSLSLRWSRKLAVLNQITKLTVAVLLMALARDFSRAQEEIPISGIVSVLGETKPIHVALDGFPPEAAAVLRFDLYVQGFDFVGPDTAQYLIHGVSVGNV